MIIISNAQRDSLVRILERLDNLDLPRTLRNTEMLRQASILRRALERRPKLDSEEISRELLKKPSKTK